MNVESLRLALGGHDQPPADDPAVRPVVDSEFAERFSTIHWTDAPSVLRLAADLLRFDAAHHYCGDCFHGRCWGKTGRLVLASALDLEATDHKAQKP